MDVSLDVQTLPNFINGEWVEADHTTEVRNPANGKAIVHVALSDKSIVGDAVAAAKQAQKEWALVPAPQRAEILYQVGYLLKERKERLARLLTMENGKVLEEARGEVQEGIDMIWLVKDGGYLGKQHQLN